MLLWMVHRLLKNPQFIEIFGRLKQEKTNFLVLKDGEVLWRDFMMWKPLLHKSVE